MTQETSRSADVTGVADDTDESKPRKRRTLWWWFTAIVTPLGIVGGPLALADMLSGVIQWNGWIGFATAYWDLYVSEPFGVVIQYVAQLFGIASVPPFVSDYLALGVLYVAAGIRVSSLVFNRSNWADVQFAEMGFFRLIAFNAFVCVGLTLAVLVWPYSAIRTCLDLLLHSRAALSVEHDPMAKATFLGAAAHMLPFALFAVLCLVNVVIGA